VAAREIRVSRVLAVEADLVWKALTTRELLAEWLMPNDFEMVLGHAFTLRTDPGPGFDGIVQARVLALDPPRAMTWAWRGGPIDTEVDFSVASLGPRRTRVTVVQRGFVTVRARVVGAILYLGWWNLLARRLPRLLRGLARGPEAHDAR